MKRLYHIGLTVRNLESAIDFYHGKLGLEYDSKPTGWVSGNGIDQKLRVPGAKLRLVNLKVGEQGILELIEYGSPASPIDKALPCNAIGSGHVCFLVDDISAKKQELEEKGVTFFSDINYSDNENSKWYWVYFADPDGIPLELMQFI